MIKTCEVKKGDDADETDPIDPPRRIAAFPGPFEVLIRDETHETPPVVRGGAGQEGVSYLQLVAHNVEEN